jgi:phosphopantetheinyl transferase (holo-ACP synthase)
MLGNDIVDLRKANVESNWKRNGYLAKIFSDREQSQIIHSNYPERLIWLLWSMKEATYKIINRETKLRLYNPKKFSCLLNEKESSVHFEGCTYYTKSSIQEHFIHTIATQKAENLGRIATYYLENKADYVTDFNLKFAPYFLAKDASGIPILIDKQNGKSHFASISHHGDYLAIVRHFFL